MRDFAKNNSTPSAKNNKKNKADNKPSTQSSLAIRKIILALLLLILIIAFIVSFYGSNKSKETAHATTTPQPLNVSPNTHPKANNTTAQNSDTHNSTTVASTPAKAEDPSTDTSIVKAPQTNDVTTKEPASENSKKVQDQKENNKKNDDQPLTFTFYNTLTNKTVQVDANPEKLKQYRYTYMLQIGSYRNQSDANATRAKLILAGLKPTIKKVGDWYRLDVGPIYSQRDGDVIKHKVEAAGISGSILRQVDKQEITPQTSDDNQ